VEALLLLEELVVLEMLETVPETAQAQAQALAQALAQEMALEKAVVTALVEAQEEEEDLALVEQEALQHLCSQTIFTVSSVLRF
jgi:hypothetical protein